MSNNYGRPYGYPSSSQYYQQQSSYAPYPYTSSLAPHSYSTSSPMSRNVSHSSSGSGSSSQAQYSDSTADSSPPRYEDIEFNYAGPTGTSAKKQSKTRPSSSSTNTGGPTPQYPCLYPGCTHQSSRPFDLMRHMKKHNPTPPEEKYDCPGKGCGRVGAHGFDRRDHMTEHLRNFHLWDIPKGTSAVPKNGSGSGGRKRSVR